MIPKIIHYIWFGGKPLPEKVEYCIESWKKWLPEYKFVLWNEESFDVNAYEFTRDAYAHRKFAFVSDFVRIFALATQGGVYLDTDIEIIKPLDVFLKERMTPARSRRSWLQKRSTHSSLVRLTYTKVVFLSSPMGRSIRKSTTSCFRICWRTMAM